MPPVTPPTRRVAAPELVRFGGAAPVGTLWVVEGVDGTVGGPLP